MEDPEFAEKQWTEDMLPNLVYIANYLDIFPLLRDSLHQICHKIPSKSPKELDDLFGKLPEFQHVLIYCVNAKTPQNWSLRKKALEKRTEFKMKCDLKSDSDITKISIWNPKSECLDYFKKNQLHLVTRKKFLVYNRLQDFFASVEHLRDAKVLIGLYIYSYKHDEDFDIDLLIQSLKMVPNLNEFVITNYYAHSENAIDLNLFPELPKLEEFRIDRFKLSHLSEFLRRDFPELKRLSFSCNLEKIGRIESMPKLEKLDLAFNRLEDINELMTSSLDNLKMLFLEKNGIKTINAIHSIPKLEYLDLKNNQLEDVTDFLNSSLGKLELLDLSYNQIKLMTNIHSMPQLKVLNLEKNQIKDMTGLLNTSFGNLNFLKISYNQIESIKTIHFMPQLKVLDLRNNSICNISDFLQSNLPELRELYLSNNHIQTTIMIYEHLMPKLPVKRTNCIP